VLWTLACFAILLTAFYASVFIYNVYLWFQPAMTFEEIDGPQG
jgi:hypothetical protein